ncbi:MAG TPA: hypothetical protein VJB93_02230 [Patescibacteria group bacterium]|nr:hypothetical protein [Patescibacteria group bacterium]
MSLKRYTVALLIGTLVMWIAWSGVLVFIDPFASGMFGVVLFYATLVCGLVGTFAMIGLGYHAIRTRGALGEHDVVVSFRHAVWYALVVNFALYLQAHGLFPWTNILLFIFLFAMIELLLLSRSR